MFFSFFLRLLNIVIWFMIYLKLILWFSFHLKWLYFALILEIYIRTEWEFAGQLLVNKSLMLCGTSWTSSVECSETDCAIRCAKVATCAACMFIQNTGNCTLLISGNVTVKNSYGSSTSVRVKDGGFCFSVNFLKFKNPFYYIVKGIFSYYKQKRVY